MGKKKFNKKQSVRFALVPGVDENGNPSNSFKPLDSNSKLSVEQKEKIINEFGDYESIEINGKPVDQSEIPSYILEQIRGRFDLTINDNLEQNDQQQMEMQEEEQFGEYEEQKWQEDEWVDEQEDIEQQKKEKVMNKELDFKNQNQFPTIKKVEFEGEQYGLSEEQAKLLDCVLPENYEQYKIKGVSFTKFNEDGNRIDQKESYEKYIIDEDTKRAPFDSYEFVPTKMADFMDNDLDPSQIKGDIKEIEDAMNYDGQEDVYEELQDDFFAELLKNNDKKPAKNKKEEKPKENIENAFKKKPKQKEVKKQEKSKKKQTNEWQQLQMTEQDRRMMEIEEQVTDEMLEKALQDFENNKEYENQSFSSFSIADIESREEYMGRDGQLDWRVLTKKQKKEYMKTKKIRQFYQELRQRQIEQKMRDKKNVSVEQLHLKNLIQHIPYQEDHVMQNAIKTDIETPANFDEQSDYETESDEDDIISYKHKTSIISSNLATVEELPKKKKKKENAQEEQEAKDIKRVKVVLEKRNKNESKEQRKQRKQKLKQLKKQKREQKQEFIEQFQSQKRKQTKKENVHNPFHKVSYVKIA